VGWAERRLPWVIDDNKRLRRQRAAIGLLSVLLALSLAALALALYCRHVRSDRAAAATVPGNTITAGQSAKGASGVRLSPLTARSGQGSARAVELSMWSVGSTTMTGSGETTTVTLNADRPEGQEAFQADGLLPGDSVSRTYQLEVSHRGAVTVGFEAALDSGSEVLAGKLACQIYIGGRLWYDGTFAELPSSLGYTLSSANSAVTETIDYRIVVSLPTDAGNEYANKTLYASFKWDVAVSTGSAAAPTASSVATTTSSASRGKPATYTASSSGDDPTADASVPGQGEEASPSASQGPQVETVEHFAYIVGYPDGNIYPNRTITRAEVATLFFRVLTEESRSRYWSQTSPFYDVSQSDWYNNAVATLASAGVISGEPGNLFLPDQPITRAEFAVMAAHFYDPDDTVEAAPFSDTQGHWAQTEIDLAYASGIVQGYSDGTFRPDQTITRAEAMTIMNRLLGRNPHEEHLLEDMLTWPDNMDKTAWYYEEIQEATNSHDYSRLTEDGTAEKWTGLLTVRDWSALEHQWSTVDSTEDPGDVSGDIIIAALSDDGRSVQIAGDVSLASASGLTQAQQEALAPYQVARLVTAEGDLGGGLVSVSVPFTPAWGTDADEYAVVYVAEDGTLEYVDSYCQNGRIVFFTNHFSDYAILRGYQPTQGKLVSPWLTDGKWLLAAVPAAALALAGLVVCILRRKGGQHDRNK
jgi:hypothetical protein